MYNHYNLQIEMPQETILPSRSLKTIKKSSKENLKKESTNQERRWV